MSIALIGGAGEGLGAALGRRFATGGLEVVLCSRTQGEKADLREESSPVDFAIIRKILLRMRSWENFVFSEGH